MFANLVSFIDMHDKYMLIRIFHSQCLGEKDNMDTVWTIKLLITLITVYKILIWTIISMHCESESTLPGHV